MWRERFETAARHSQGAWPLFLSSTRLCTPLCGASCALLHVTPLWVCRYGSAVVVGASIALDRNSWDQGFFVTAAEDIAPWLGIVVVVAAVVSNVGIYQASLATTGRALWAMAGGAPDEVPDAMVVSNVGAACCNPV